MSRTNTVFKEAYNRCLGGISGIGLAGNLPPETELAKAWGISRTTVRAVLEQMSASGIIDWEGRRKVVLRLPKRGDYFADDETQSMTKRVEEAFMGYILDGDLAPGTILRESELARELQVSASAVREFLIRFSRFGLIEKEPNRHWVLRGFTRAYAIELFDVREMFETRALDRFCATPLDDATRKALESLRKGHLELLANLDRDFTKFSRQDEEFHTLFLGRLDNRFVADFFQIIKVIFHFHYRWNKSDELERNKVALNEHLAVLDAFLAQDLDLARAAFGVHLASARRTLLQSVHWDDEK